MALVRVCCVSAVRLYAPTQVPRFVSSYKKTIAEKLGLPEPPKKPISNYFHFLEHHREDVLKEFPDLRQKEVITKLSHLWQNLSPAEKEEWTQKSEREKAAYDIQYINYVKMMNPKDLNKMKKLEKKLKNKKQQKYIRRRKNIEGEKLGKPKLPNSPFMMFLELLKIPELSRKEFSLEAGRRWQSLPEDEKKVFLEKARKERDQYERELTEWEAKMAKEGRYDLLRSKQKIMYKLFLPRHQDQQT
ncbi:hypothetical protein OTU49_006682 [Cherax quadricarinatus]|uniref:HMG box domain-containing protein n=1 Tax=Cherax quadricarinatus TaxID=27406 RepID=A0AAW0WZW6_CHEQU